MVLLDSKQLVSNEPFLSTHGFPTPFIIPAREGEVFVVVSHATSTEPPGAEPEPAGTEPAGAEPGTEPPGAEPPGAEPGTTHATSEEAQALVPLKWPPSLVSVLKNI